ncbi:type B DNA-directed DNA polymerase [Salinigranum halophilum]|uniref:type B DNA-directed DNA polymerase n=1 Tax=Salinigranum halophilum TaxID=2565931 RepID=UPI0010A91206|nr:type B DNA-directed DNA polymerase [Salinigranum halophilum]
MSHSSLVPFKFEFDEDGTVTVWQTSEEQTRRVEDTSYRPRMYVTTTGPAAPSRAETAGLLEELPLVDAVSEVQRRPSWRRDSESVLAVDIDGPPSAVSRVARQLHTWETPGTYRCFNVDFSPQFRYCLERDIDPTPPSTLPTLSLGVDLMDVSNPPLDSIEIDGTTHTGSPTEILDRVTAAIDERDPDVFVVDTAELVPTLFEMADVYGYDDFTLGREPGWTQLAGKSTYTSYGRVGHSPARYDIPGRVIVNRANTFFFDESNLDGCLDLVERSRKPLQELAWASIGNVLTAIQIREACSRNVLVQWKSWRPERFKTMRQLHEADRGGFTFAPDVGLHEDVHELDFSSLYPNIIVTRNISPETVRCDCHDRDDVPGLGYSICDEPGYLPDVLEPIISDRDEIKDALAEAATEAADPECIRRLEGRSAALKWILVSCFGYQGFSNAKFGRIECHESINAFAREILLDAKDVLEQNGWEIVHGIVDSLWVTPMSDVEQTPLPELCVDLSESTEIRLEYEDAYDWIAFCLMRDSEAGALTKYFGRVRGRNEYKYRGIECRQRSTPPFVADAQRDLIETLDTHREPEAVCERLQYWRGQLRRGDVGPDELVIDNRVSKRREQYTHATRNVAAFERAATMGLDISPGESLSYIVVDDSHETADRVRLTAEAGERYDTAFYDNLLIRAAVSVLSPLGWREQRIRAYCAETTRTTLRSFASK